jgi:pimeloyl-ACP methyl ester carboxylesterase
MGAVPEASERSIVVRGLRVRYLHSGAGDPVVLAHGWPTSSLLWRHQIPGLARRLQVFAPDWPGFGASEIPEPALGLDELAVLLLGFLDEVGLARASVVAHDLGGPAALLAAAREPDRIARLVILNTTPYAELPWAVRALVQISRTPLVGRLLVTRMGFRIMFRVGTANPTTDSRALAGEHWRNVVGRAGRRSLVRVLAATRTESLARLERSLGAITCPALVLWAERDRTAPLRIAYRLAGDLPAATLQTIPDAGHFVPGDAPEDVTERLLDFLADSA